MAERWRKAWGEEVVAAAARLIAVPPPIDLIGEPPADLGGISLMPGHLRLARGTAVAGLAGYGEGKWWVQDISASIPARLLGRATGRTALDLCAAPGGKTMQLAAAGWDGDRRRRVGKSSGATFRKSGADRAARAKSSPPT